MPVCSNSQTSGYWLGGPVEVNHWIRETRRRGLDLLDTANKMAAHLDRTQRGLE